MRTNTTMLAALLACLMMALPATGAMKMQTDDELTDEGGGTGSSGGGTTDTAGFDSRGGDFTYGYFDDVAFGDAGQLVDPDVTDEQTREDVLGLADYQLGWVTADFVVPVTPLEPFDVKIHPGHGWIRGLERTAGTSSSVGPTPDIQSLWRHRIGDAENITVSAVGCAGADGITADDRHVHLLDERGDRTGDRDNLMQTVVAGVEHNGEYEDGMDATSRTDEMTITVIPKLTCIQSFHITFALRFVFEARDYGLSADSTRLIVQRQEPVQQVAQVFVERPSGATNKIGEDTLYVHYLPVVPLEHRLEEHTSVLEGVADSLTRGPQGTGLDAFIVGNVHYVVAYTKAATGDVTGRVVDFPDVGAAASIGGTVDEVVLG